MPCWVALDLTLLQRYSDAQLAQSSKTRDPGLSNLATFARAIVSSFPAVKTPFQPAAVSRSVL